MQPVLKFPILNLWRFWHTNCGFLSKFEIEWPNQILSRQSQFCVKNIDQQLKNTQNWLCLDKIWFGHSIFFKFYLRKHNQNFKILRYLRLEISVLAATQRQSFSTVQWASQRRLRIIWLTSWRYCSRVKHSPISWQLSPRWLFLLFSLCK